MTLAGPNVDLHSTLVFQLAPARKDAVLAQFLSMALGTGFLEMKVMATGQMQDLSPTSATPTGALADHRYHIWWVLFAYLSTFSIPKRRRVYSRWTSAAFRILEGLLAPQ